jgi:DNA mismatch repair protein MutS
MPLPEGTEVLRTYRGDWMFDADTARDDLTRRFGVLSLEGYGIESGDVELVAACGALIAYVAEVQPSGSGHLRPPQVEHVGDSMPLDEMTRRNLELVEPMRGGGREGTLLGVLDEALTPMGGRLLRRWLQMPLLRLQPIQQRQAAVAELVAGSELLQRLRAALTPIRDLERLAAKVGTGRAAPRELLAVAESLQRVPRLIEELVAADSSLLRHLAGGMDPLDDVRERIEAAIDPDAPAQISDGGYIRAGYDAELDELRAVRDGAVDWIARLQASGARADRHRIAQGRVQQGVRLLHRGHPRQPRPCPTDYQRKQTLANAERYVTPELKEWEEKVLGAEEKDRCAGGAALDASAAARPPRDVPRLQAAQRHVAAVDVPRTRSRRSRCARDYVRPEIDDGFGLEIRGGRHPVVETMMPREEFIPNDVRLDRGARVMILTGPNMAGKSTVLRQVGLIVLLAQIGPSCPPAGPIGLVDRIFTRVGASDNLVRGQSTFMVEMNETAAILHGATARSLVLLDEIGRGDLDLGRAQRRHRGHGVPARPDRGRRRSSPPTTTS